jgi:hypothetical protein
MAEAGEAERFFESLKADFDTASALRWMFLLSGATEDQVEPLMEEISRLGFADIEPLIDDEQEARFILGFSEVRVHTAQSFAERAAVVKQLADREGLTVDDVSAGLPEPK